MIRAKEKEKFLIQPDENINVIVQLGGNTK
jgi:hypothetical protein